MTALALNGARPGRATTVTVQRMRGAGMRVAWGEAKWPYGPAHSPAMREPLLKFAEQRRLRLTKQPRGCLHWLASGRCGVSDCTSELGQKWFDHGTSWVGVNQRGGNGADNQARLLLGQPYAGSLTPEVLGLLYSRAVVDLGLELEVLPAPWYSGAGGGVFLWANRHLAG